MTPLLLSLALLAALLAGAILFQLRLGLRPLARLEVMVGEVRAGRRARVEVTEPSELLPLVGELNAMIDANDAALARARGHVANLAHGLKTPLARLRLTLAEEGSAASLAELDRIDASIRHHLGRARLASGVTSGVPAVALAPHISGLADALARIHAERAIAARLNVPADLRVRCDPQDLDELLGNLMDNAWRWARAAVEVRAWDDGRTAAITIADDGPGIAPDALARLARPGERLDERGEGHGFGIPIARELAELYGGAILFGDAGSGGLLVRITLPT